MDDNDLLQKSQLNMALFYSQRGWKVVPLHTPYNSICSCRKKDCSSVGKHPRTKNGLKDATCDEVKITRWWTMWPDANIGIITGKDSGIVVVDVDDRHDGDDSLKELERAYGPLPTTVEVITGGGGSHYYFKYPDEHIKNSAGKLGDGLDIRGDGGYVVAPPSLHASGKRYEWEASGHPEDVELAEMPEWMVKLLTVKQSKPAVIMTPREIVPAVGGQDEIPEGKRNDALASIAGKLRRQGKNEVEILASLLATNTLRCNPPLDDDEVRRIAHSIAQYEQSDPTYELRETVEGFAVENLDSTPYLVNNGSLACIKREKSGDIVLRLANFVAQVTEEIEKDDGAGGRAVFYKIEGRLSSGQSLPPVMVESDKFEGMNWVSRWGLKAIITPAHMVKEHLRVAIQLMSVDAPKRQIYAHTGWREIDGKWYYLTGSGAIPDDISCEVELDGALNRYCLPSDTSPDAIPTARKFLDIAAPDIVVPLFAMTYLAPLVSFLDPMFMVWLHGPSGSMKTTIAALVMAQFGDFSVTSLPASWEATANALEKLCFIAKDAVMIIDDFPPAANVRDARILANKAQRMIRSVGNRSGRNRMKSDTSLQQTYFPRCMPLSTGEQLPPGHSINARLFSVEVNRTAINMEKLSELQACAGNLPYAMKAYIEYLADKLNSDADFVNELNERWRQLRSEAQAKNLGHMRYPEATAHLILGFEMGLNFLRSVQVITESDYEHWKQIGIDALIKGAINQGSYLEEEDPTIKFLQIIDELIKSEKVTLNPIGQRQMPNAEELGIFNDGNEQLESIGWADFDYIYLFPRGSYQIVVEHCRKSGENFPLSESALRKHLIAKDVLIPGTERNRNTTMLTVAGKQIRVLKLRRDKYSELVGINR